MQEKITSCLWFDKEAKEAAAFYTTHFPDSRILQESQVVMEIEVSGYRFMLLNGGPMHKPNPSISFFYISEDEETLQNIWIAFSEGGIVMMDLEAQEWSPMYGWLNDRWGVSWQFALGEIAAVGQVITPSLLFTEAQAGRANEAIEFYSGVFSEVTVDGILRYEFNENPNKPGTVKHAQVALNGQKFMFMDSALPHGFSFSEGVSFVIHCEDQEAIDYYWCKLTEGGEESMCGWLKDRFGISWQVLPTVLGKLMSDPSKSANVGQVLMTMKKLDLARLLAAGEK